MSLSIVSCGSDKEDEPTGDSLMDKLQGTWTADYVKLNFMGQTMEMTFDEFKREFGYDAFYDDVLTFNGMKVNGSTYWIDGNKILLPWYEEAEWWQTVSFSGNKMTLYLDADLEGVRMKTWITYIKNGGRSEYPSFDAQTSIVKACKGVFSF